MLFWVNLARSDQHAAPSAQVVQPRREAPSSHPWTTADIPNQHGRTALVTGANTGIRFHEAPELARKGAQVLLASRNPERGRTARTAILRELPAASVQLVHLDLADLDSIRRLTDQLLDRDQGLDLLVNNAGVMAVPHRQTTAKGFELQLGTNHLEHFALTGGCCRPCWPAGTAGS